ncbi:MAG: hypothetical protein LBO64_03290 [Desulfovibrio sp.]|jgi:hypothetical protein|nr:hypothetical protein [Desulfovibrio sp.]
MNAAAYAVLGKIPVLAWEAEHLPACRETALAWLRQAAKWARARGYAELAEEAAAAVAAKEKDE